LRTGKDKMHSKSNLWVVSPNPTPNPLALQAFSFFPFYEFMSSVIDLKLVDNVRLFRRIFLIGNKLLFMKMLKLFQPILHRLLPAAG